MIKLLEKLSQNHSNFDNIWNEDGRDTQEYMVKNAPQMLSRLSEWYVKQGKLIKDLERTVKEEI
jgi:hypothetical protein